MIQSVHLGLEMWRWEICTGVWNLKCDSVAKYISHKNACMLGTPFLHLHKGSRFIW